VRFIEKLNTPVAAVIVLLLFLALDGFLLYRYQRDFLPAGSGLTAFEETTLRWRTIRRRTRRRRGRTRRQS
jgi:prophage maintenance system killer protein